MFDIAGSLVFVSGASSGFGEHFVELFARRGARVVAAARRTEKLEALCARLTGCEVCPVALDVTQPDSVRAAVHAAHEWGGGAIDILVNNAGVSVEKLAIHQDADDWDYVLNTNLRGAFLLAAECAQGMKQAKVAGRIINIASVMGISVGKMAVGYSTSKAGMIHMTKVLALEWAKHRIRVNCIAPGFVVTNITRHLVGGEADQTPFGKEIMRKTPVRRFGQPGDMDGVMLLLACPKASAFMTGTIIPVDGGLTVASL